MTLDDRELADLFRGEESDRVEHKSSAADKNDIRKVVCAFANDLAASEHPGVIFVGRQDDGGCADLEITDELLRELAQMKDDGAITPFPSLDVYRRVIDGCTVAVIVVHPAHAPPIRFRGRVWVRVGTQTTQASPEDERRLNERRRYRDAPYDLQVVSGANIEDLDLERFDEVLLPSVVPPELVDENRRSIEDRLASLRLVAGRPAVPTVVGLLTLGHDPRVSIPGAYVQFLRIDGRGLSDPIKDAKDLSGPLDDLLRRIDEILQAHIAVSVDIVSGPVEVRRPDYPLAALQQIIRNAILHRSYEGTASPVRVTWFTDRIEVQNPGGPYGQVTRENFGVPGVTDYRNPHLAEMMKYLGFVQRFGLGIAIARDSLAKNGNPDLEFTVEPTYVLAVIRRPA